jgi:hypothetical protein
MEPVHVPLVNPKAHFLDQLHWTDQFRNVKDSTVDSARYRKQYDLLFESRRRSRWPPTFLWNMEEESGGSVADAEQGDGGLCCVPNNDGQILVAEVDESSKEPSVMTAANRLPRLELGKVHTKSPDQDSDLKSKSDTLSPADDNPIPSGQLITKGPSGQMLPPYMIERELAR